MPARPRPAWLRSLLRAAAPALASTILAAALAAPAQAATYTAAADANTRSDQPTKNYGTSSSLESDGYPVKRTYLRFDMQGLDTAVTKATLRLYTKYSISTSGLEVRSVADSGWGETTLTHANAPAPGPVVASHGSASAYQWISIDVTPLVSGNGKVSMALTTTSSTARRFAARESGARAPQLFVETEAGPASDPVPPSDTTAPDTTITSGPSGSTSSASATFSFTSSESGSTFECRLDGVAWAGCSSPRDYSGLADGSHTFDVRAKDAAGNVDGSPASRSWTVQTASAPPPDGSSSLAPLAESTGTVFHVSTAGSDANPGTSTQPWRTVQKAIDALQAGQRALVHSGTYTQALNLSRACTAAAPCTVEGAPGEPRPVLRITTDHVLRVNSAGAYWRFKGLTFRDSDVTSGGLVDLYGHHLEFSGNELTSSGDQDFYLDEGSHHVQILGNWMHHSGLGRTHQSHGAYVQGDDHLLANNLVHDHPYGFGVQVYDKGLRAMVVNNTITHNAHAGVVVGGSGGVSGVVVRNNVLAYNRDYGIAWDSTCPNGSSGTTYADHNVLYGNGSGGVDPQGCSAVSTAGGNRSGDPMFADTAARDLHLRAASPAVGYAVADWSPSVDRDGEGRPQGAAPDASAYEDG
jgi:hypothetical protein